MLNNPFYVGKISFKGNVYDGQHEPIVPMDLFEKVQEIVKSNKDTQSRPRKQNLHTFLLQGLVRCGNCGSFMTPYYGYNPKKVPYFYYACTKNQHVGEDGCQMYPVSAPALEKVVEERLVQLNDDDDLVSELVGEGEIEGNLVPDLFRDAEIVPFLRRDGQGRS